MAREGKRNLSRRFGDTLDRAIGVFDPVRAGRRQYARAMMDVANLAYRSAERSRLRDWNAPSGSADADQLNDLETLRHRSRDAIRNQPLAHGTLGTLVANELGTGLRVQADVDGEALGLSRDQEHDLESAIDLAWNEWTPHADYAQRLTFGQLVELVRMTQFTDGELLAVRRFDPGAPGPFGLRVDLIEADRLGTPLKFPTNARDRDIRDGVELGRRGEPVAYWVRRTHPGDMWSRSIPAMDDYVRIPVRDALGRRQVLHIYKQNRIGASHGVPELAPVLSLLRDLDQYIESETVAARVAACFSAFITVDNPWDESTGAVTGTDALDRRLEELYPGMVERLGPGEGVEFGNPSRPGSPFEVFIDRTIQLFSAAIGVPPQVLTQNWQEMNYSSMRGALIEAWRSYRRNAMWLWESFGRPVREWFIEDLVAMEAIVQPRATVRQLAACRVLLPGREWVDPLKEVAADEKAVQAKLMTFGDVLHKRGVSVDEYIRQLQRERAKFEAAGEEYPGDREVNTPGGALDDSQDADDSVQRRTRASAPALMDEINTLDALN